MFFLNLSTMWEQEVDMRKHQIFLDILWKYTIKLTLAVAKHKLRQKGKIYITLFAGLCYMKPLLAHLLNIRGNRF